MGIEEMKSLFPTRAVYEDYFQTYYGPLLEANGLTKVKGPHWVRLCDDQVLTGVHFVQEKSWFYLYYSLQPLFFPVVFPTKQSDYHQRRMSFFNAELIFCRKFKVSSYNNATPLYEGSREKTVKYYQAMLNHVVLPAFQKIRDVETCHQVYLEQRSLDPLVISLDTRNLLECVYLNLEDECERFLNRELVPLLQRDGPDFRVPLEYEWLKRSRSGQYGVPVKDLIDSLSGDRQLLWKWMKQTEEKSRKTVQKAFGIG